MGRVANRLERETAEWSDADLVRLLKSGNFIVNPLLALCAGAEAARRLEMSICPEAILAGGKALHGDWRKAFFPGGKWADFEPNIKRECLFAWENLHPENRASYLHSSAIIAAAIHGFKVSPHGR